MANRALAARALPVERREKPSFGGARFGSYAARLAGAKKSIEGLSGWYIVETPHYIFVTNQANRKVIRQLQGDLEAARKGFQLYFPARDDAAAVGVVKVFAKRQEYLQHLPPGREWSAGLWSSATQELLVSPPGFKTDKKTAAKQIREVTLHEAFHQYIFDASGESHAAPWFNEGSAEFFERSLPQQGDFGILDAETERQLAQTVARAPGDLKDFLLLDQAGYYAGNRRLFHYRLGHALMYYLLRGAPALGEKEAADLPARYLEALRATRNGRRATERILIGLDTGKLAAQLKNFWSSRSALQRARRYRKLP